MVNPGDPNAQRPPIDQPPYAAPSPGYGPPPSGPAASGMGPPGYQQPVSSGASAPQPQYAGPPQPYQQSTPSAPPWTTTKTMALVSVVLGSFSFLLDFMCGVGIGLGVVSAVVGYLAFQRAKTYNEPTGMALAGLIISGAAVAFGALWFLFMGAAMSGF